MKIITFIKNYFYPPVCPGCGGSVLAEGELCDNCFEQCFHVRELKTNSIYLEEVWTLADYTGGIKNIIRDVKFNYKKERALGVAPFLHIFFETDYLNLKSSKPDYVIPVPVGSKKTKERGYNQVEVFFKKRILEEGYVWLDLLAKSNDTRPMWNLSKEERAFNLKNAYHIKSQYVNLENGEVDIIKNKEILLLDDIYTTGATVNQIAMLLKKGGAKKIKALTIASGA